MDKVCKSVRSIMMSKVRSKDTIPEVLIRKALYHIGVRYRLHDKSLPGKPDIVVGKYRTIVLVNGCFWHQHGCSRSLIPETNSIWWNQKLLANKYRDINNLKLLLSMQWKVVILWECGLKGKQAMPTQAIVDAIKGFMLDKSKLICISSRGIELVDEVNEVYYE